MDDELKSERIQEHVIKTQIIQHLKDSRYCFNCFCSTDNVPIGPAALDSYCMFFNKALNDEQDGNTPRLQECIERFGE